MPEVSGSRHAPEQRALLLGALALSPPVLVFVWGWRGWSIVPLIPAAVLIATLGRPPRPRRQLVAAWVLLAVATLGLAMSWLGVVPFLSGLLVLCFPLALALLFFAIPRALSHDLRTAVAATDPEAPATQLAMGARLAALSSGASMVLADEGVLAVPLAALLVALAVLARVALADRRRARWSSSLPEFNSTKNGPFREDGAPEVGWVDPVGHALRRRALAQSLGAAAALSLLTVANHEWLVATGLQRFGVIDPPTPTALLDGSTGSRGPLASVLNTYERVGDVRVPGGSIWRGTIVLDLADDSITRRFVTDEGIRLSPREVMARVRTWSIVDQVRVRLALQETLAGHTIFAGRAARARGLPSPWSEGALVHAWVHHPRNPTPHHLVLDFATESITDLTP
ncbi:MAG: hypothetical protein EPO40_03245 [Myxococcaceae bacterium]|nr:MAG: hypothetical protein EPO40_03245 [Myxococcaceae bacterium]